jgi:MOSC domain-containing protein YiiM
MMVELGASLSAASRRANLLVSGIDLKEARGRTLRVGAAAIQLRGETRPCERMDEAFQGLRAAMSTEWRGGAFGVVLQGGRITVGDEVTLEDA